jgi:hypothetical protein
MSKKMRNLFTDGWNSFWHFVFGILGYYSWLTVVLFVLYQLQDPFETNITVDLTEFLLGYLTVYVYESF